MPFFEPVSGIDVVKLPPVPAKRDRYPARYGLSCGYDQINLLREKLILEALRCYKHEAVLVDHRPLGEAGELKSVLEAVVRQSPRPRIYFGMRDIDSTPEDNQ